MKGLAITICVILVLSVATLAQTMAFNYQGKLTDAGNPANGSFQMQFKLFDSLGGASQVGSTIADVPVTVSQGVFSVKLDFGSSAMSGANRWLEIAIRHNSSESYTTLSPREQIASSPYAVRTLSAASADNALNLGGVAANQFVQTNDARLSDSRNPLPNSANYIQNTLSQQASSNFSISGNGFIGGNFGVGTTSPVSKLDVRGNLTLEAGANPVLYTSSASTEQNRYLQVINSVSSPTAAGIKAGGMLIADAYGFANPGKNDLVVKGAIGIGTASPQSPLSVQTIGNGYGFTHTNGSVTVGSFVDSQGGWLGTKSNHDLYFFANDSLPQMTLKPSGKLGVGTITPGAKIHGLGSGSDWAVMGESNSGVGVVGLSLSGTAIFGQSGTGLAGQFIGNVQVAGSVGIGTSPSRLLHVNGRARIGDIPLEAWNAHVCFNAAGDLLNCNFSSLRAKTNVHAYRTGLDVVRRLRPIGFNWKENGLPGVGLGAEDVAKVAPSLIETNEAKEVTGVKYERLSLLLINAVKEQQAQIERLQRQFDGIKKQLCRIAPRAGACREKGR